MGNCSMQNQKKLFELQKNIKNLEKNAITKYDEIHKQDLLPYTPLEGNFFYYGNIIYKFITFQKKRKKREKLINELQKNLKSSFLQQKIDYNSEYIKDIKFKTYFSEKLDKLIYTFFALTNGESQNIPNKYNNNNNKTNNDDEEEEDENEKLYSHKNFNSTYYIQNPIKSKKIINFPEILNNLNQFNNIREFVKHHYAQITMFSQLNFYTKFIDFLKNLNHNNNNPTNNNYNNSLNRIKKSNFKQSKSKGNNALKKLINQITFDMNYKNKFFYLKFNDIVSDNDRKIFESDIDNLYKICLDTPYNKIPMKFKDLNKFNVSYLLILLNNDFLLGPDGFLKGELRVFVKKMYYIYIMKKYNFISKTDDFYRENSEIKQINLTKLSFENIDSNDNDNKYKKNINKNNNNIEEDLTTIRVIPDNQKLPPLNLNSEEDEIQIDNTEEKNSSNDDNKEKYSDNKNEYDNNKDNNKSSDLQSENDSIEHFKSISETQSENNLNENTPKFLYNGEYDNTNYLYAGFGTLLDIENNSCYEGMFRYGKKSGIGIFWQEDISLMNSGEYTFYYYSGEWTNNEKDGYGIEITIKKYSTEFNVNKLLNTVLLGMTMNIKIGIYKKNIFVSGEIYEYVFENNLEGNEEKLKKIPYHSKKNINLCTLIYNNYRGDLHSKTHKYIGHGEFNSKSFVLNMNTSNYEPRLFYKYNGNFIDGLENGDGILQKILYVDNYSFTYKGNFEKGKMDGFGVIEYNDNFFIKRYEGFFKEGNKFHMYGIVEFRSGDIYEGFFDETFHKDYIGLYIHENKNKKENNFFIKDNYFGFFNKDKKHGGGRFISIIDRKSLIGKYVNGEKQGQFQVTSEEIIKENIYDLFYDDLNDDMSDNNILKLATRKKATISNSNYFVNRDKKKNKLKNNKENKISVKQIKMYYFFENDELLDSNEKPFDI